MKIILTFLLTLLVSYSFAQISVVNQLQVKSAAGVPSGSSPGSNYGLMYGDANGVQKKGTLMALIGSRIRSVSAASDSTLTIATDSATYTVKIRGLLGIVYKNYLDSLKAGTVIDSNSVIFVGNGTRLGWVSVTGDSLMMKNEVDSTVGIVTYPDSSLHPYVKPSGITPGTYGDASHIPQITIGSDGRATAGTQIAISGGSAAKKTLNTVAGTTYQLIGSDSASYIQTTNASSTTITVPDDATTAMGAPVSLDIFQFGAGKVTLSPLNSNVSIYSRKGVLRTAGQYSKVNLYKIKTNVWQVSGDLDTATVPIIAYSGSLSPFRTTAGTVSSVQSLTISGSNLTGNLVWAAPSDLQISPDNSTWGSSATYTPSSGSVSGTIYLRTSASTTAGNYAGTIQGTSSGAATVNVPYVDTVSAILTATDSMRVQFDTVASNNEPGWTHLTGSPNFAIHSVTGLGVGGAFSVANTTNWTPVTTVCALPNNGVYPGNVWNYAQDILRESWFTYNTSYVHGTYQVVIGGLNPSKTYSIQLTGTLNASYTGFNCSADYRVEGSAVSPVQTINFQPGGVANTSTSLTFSSLVPNGSGQLFIYVNPHSATGQNAAVLSAFILYQY